MSESHHYVKELKRKWMGNGDSCLGPDITVMQPFVISSYILREYPNLEAWLNPSLFLEILSP